MHSFSINFIFGIEPVQASNTSGEGGNDSGRTVHPRNSILSEFTEISSSCSNMVAGIVLFSEDPNISRSDSLKLMGKFRIEMFPWYKISLVGMCQVPCCCVFQECRASHQSSSGFTQQLPRFLTKKAYKEKGLQKHPDVYPVRFIHSGNYR